MAVHYGLTCKNKIDFIKKLYQYMQEYDRQYPNNKVCFISGAFVFEDPGLKLFDFMKKEDCEQYILNKSRSGILTKTHGSFFAKNRMITRRITNKNINNINNINNNAYKINTVFSNKHSKKKGIFGYSDLQHQVIIDPPINYICDEKCIDLDRKSVV